MKISARQWGLLLLPIVLAGCQHSPESYNSQNRLASCSSNVYLTKYHCSIERIQQAAENGSADAQYALGYMYYYGISTVRDPQTAELWIQRAAAQGQPLARQALALMHSDAQFNDLHQAAQGAVSGSLGNGDSSHQKAADVARMNAQVHDQPVTQHLPNYRENQSQTTHSTKNANESQSEEEAKPPLAKHTIRDPRLLSAAKPISAESLNEVSKGALHSRYTIQLMSSAKKSALTNFIRMHHLAGRTHTYRTKLHGKPWYMLTYGAYPSEGKAIMALHELSASMKRNHPWVKSVKTIQSEVKQQRVFS